VGSGNDEGKIRQEGRKRKRKGGNSGGKNNNIITAVITKNGGDIVTQNSNEYSDNNSQTTAVERENTYTRRSQLLEASNNGTDQRGTSQHDATTNMTTRLEQEVRFEVVHETGDTSTTDTSQEVQLLQKELEQKEVQETILGSSQQDATTNRTTRLEQEVRFGVVPEAGDTSTTDTSQEVELLRRELDL